jgi:hypothetical protein
MNQSVPITLPIRLVSMAFSALPALIFFICALSLFQGEYFWSTYVITGGVYLIGSLVAGFILPGLVQGRGVGAPWVWIMLQGLAGWVAALGMLWLLSLTPLCVGQDNGDGVNNLGMCVMQAGLVSVAFTPAVALVLWLSAFIGSQALERLLPKEEDWFDLPV